MVDILKNEDGRQIVKLSENYSYGSHITTAALAENVILIDVLLPGRKSKQFTLTADEMDALADAWAQFKHTQHVAKELERKRIAKFVEDAPLKSDEPQSEQKNITYTITMSGATPPNTTFSSGMESRYNLCKDGGQVKGNDN